MELLVLTVPECPNAAVLEERLAEVLADRPGVSVVRRVIDDAADAVRFGMRGSPTVLVDGVDPFAEPGTATSVSCRMYRGAGGRVEGAPSVAALRQALKAAEARAGWQTPLSTPSWSDQLGRAGRGRVAPVEGGLRAVHRRVLRSFAETGRVPSMAELAEVAASYGADAGRVLAELHAADFLRLDETGQVRAAYPFSATPTAHVVQIAGGPRVFSMCAIDALGIAPMLGTEVTVRSADAAAGEPVTVTVAADGQGVVWDPVTAVVFAGQRIDCGSCADTATGSGIAQAAVDVCCGYVNFFATRVSATEWVDAHPGVSGQILEQDDALRLGRQIFGPLLADAG